MTRLELLLLIVCLGVVGADVAIVVLGGFQVDGPVYAALFLLSASLLAGGIFYRRVRPDARLAAMLFSAAFLTAFTAAAAVLNYLMLPFTGTRVDMVLASWDIALGFYWPDAMAAIAQWPLLSPLLLLVYNSGLFQVALLAILLPPSQAYRFCLAIAAGALICIGIWTVFPSFGAFAVYSLDDALVATLRPQADDAYARELIGLLGQGPAVISPTTTKGLIGFPSYHTVMALLTMWFAWKLRGVRWPLLALNILMLFSIPLHGGHHLVDVLAGFPVAAIAIICAGVRDFPLKSGGMVNRLRIYTASFVSKSLFRAETTQVALRDTSRD